MDSSVNKAKPTLMTKVRLCQKLPTDHLTRTLPTSTKFFLLALYPLKVFRGNERSLRACSIVTNELTCVLHAYVKFHNGTHYSVY